MPYIQQLGNCSFEVWSHAIAKRFKHKSLNFIHSFVFNVLTVSINETKLRFVIRLRNLSSCRFQLPWKRNRHLWHFDYMFGEDQSTYPVVNGKRRQTVDTKNSVNIVKLLFAFDWELFYFWLNRSSRKWIKLEASRKIVFPLLGKAN